MQQIQYCDLGKISFHEAWAFQENLLNQIVDIKLHNRKDSVPSPTPNYLLLCEHPHVFTLGKSGNEKNLLITQSELVSKAASFHKINRGGDITYHGPGQIVGYPILDLDNFFNDIHKYMRSLEEVIIRTLAEFGIRGERIEKCTGVWLDAGIKKKARKICAFGVRCSRWVTMHGFAFNVNTDLKYFDHIIPCGISDKSVTSVKAETGRLVNLADVKEKLLRHFGNVFNAEIVEKASVSELI